MKKYYVYLYMREDMYSPYYVGSGSNDRCYSSVGNGDRIPPNDRDLIRIVYEGEEKECRELEGILILFYGLELLENKVIPHTTPLTKQYCEEKQRDWDREYMKREDVIERGKERKRKWREENKDRVREYKRKKNREYYQRNKERIKEKYLQKKRSGL